jgi:ribonucleotide reductase beta subunit family protein with ferritin-like domain
MISINASDRKDLLNKLSDILTVNESASLIAKIHEKTSTLSKGKRFGLYPIEDWGAFERNQKLQASLWLASEVEFSNDKNDFNDFTKEEQWPLIMAFGFFAVGDGSITSMLAYQMIVTANSFENQMFYATQLFNETIHGETYGKMVYSLISDPNKRDEIFNAVENVKSIKAMNAFIEDAFTYPEGKRQIYVSLAAAEYLMFTPLFCIIFWYRAYKKGKIPQIIFSNEQISKDECSHCVNGTENYRGLDASEKYTDEEVHAYIDKVVQLVSNFADEVFADIKLPELTAENVKQYIRFVADDLFDRLGHPAYYHDKSPFCWMDFTELIPKTNFYEGTVGQYSRFNVQVAVQNAYDLCHGKEEKVVVNAYKKPKKF